MKKTMQCLDKNLLHVRLSTDFSVQKLFLMIIGFIGDHSPSCVHTPRDFRNVMCF